MVMKMLIFVSMQMQRAWNERATEKVSDEAALRFPNIFFGALTVIPLFLLTAAFFDKWTGLIAAPLWACGVNAITYNRIAKEDTLLVFFMLCAFYLYLRAKQISGYKARLKNRFYTLSGAAFGLMLAAKYFPHYFGLNMLYHHFVHVRERAPGEPAGRTPSSFYIIVGLVFLLANPAVLLPQTWSYLRSYTSEQLLTHTGYLIGNDLYHNTMSSTPFWSTPIYFYLLFLFTKVPLPIIFALIVGLFQAARKPHHPGHAFLLLMFILWIVPYSLAGAKWLRYTLSLMPFVYMLAATGLMWMIRCLAQMLRGREGIKSPPLRLLATTLLLIIFIALPALAAYTHKPHYALYTTWLARNSAGYFFPHDEFYYDGLREAIRYVCAVAPQGAMIVHETPHVVRYYLEKYGRTDLQSRVLSSSDFQIEDAPQPSFIIVQRGRTYFENAEKIKEVRALWRKTHEVYRQNISVAEVYINE